MRRTLTSALPLGALIWSALAATAEATPRAPIPGSWWLAPAGSVAALVFAYLFYKSMLARDPGNETMRNIAGHVRAGAMAYLRQQYKVVIIFFVVVSILLAIMAFVFHAQSGWVPFAFLTGGFFSGLAGYCGMTTATHASSRTARGAQTSLNQGLQVAFRSGAVMGLTVVGLGLIDICLWFFILYEFTSLSLVEITVTMLCFGMGASSQALFARVGGGIFTKAADVGADLVGKVEAGIPEDDPRNPATIADNVGDNVGDVAGMGADLYESYCGSILSTAALGVAAALSLELGLADQIKFVVAPMTLAGVGIFLSIAGIFAVRTKEDASSGALLMSLRRGIWGSSILIFIAALFVTCWILPEGYRIGTFGAIASGLIAGVIIGYATEYYTASEYSPTKQVADQAKTGPATVIIAGVAEGMMSTWVPILVVGVATILAFAFAGGFTNATLGLYGIGFAAVGMLSTLGITLATDAYGPIADNAGGNAQMSGLDPEVRKRTDALDSLGNTTAATGKGFAIGSAALTALALLAAYVEEVRMGQVRLAEAYVEQYELRKGSWNSIDEGQWVFKDKNEKVHSYMLIRGEETPQSVYDAQTLIGLKKVYSIEGRAKGEETARAHAGLIPSQKASMKQFMTFYEVHLMNPVVLVGMFLGVLLVFVFCAMTMKAVGRAAGKMVEEVRRQFREIPGIMDGAGTPDYASCVAISTRGAQREMIVPSLTALAVPLLVGLLLGVPGVMGLLSGGLICGFAVAIFMANAGGIWDNAKKYIEEGHLGGKGSDPHKAAVVGDTVGDPFKDTSGPSLNILIKLMAMVSVVFAGMTVAFGGKISEWLG